MKELKILKKTSIILTLYLMVFLPYLSAGAEADFDITNIEVDNIDGKTVKIEWSTSVDSNGKVLFGEERDNLSYFIIDGNPAAKYHSVNIGNLKDETTYYYKVIAFDSESQVESYVKKFKTEEFNDGVPPQISNLKVPYISGTAAVVAWETDEKSSSRVEYNSEGTYNSKAGSGDKVTNHLVILKKLKPNTQYYLRAYSADKDDNSSSYFYKEFTTSSTDASDKEDLIITNLRPSGPSDTNISAISVKVSFKTNHYAKGKISLKKSGSKKIIITADYGLSHSVVFSGLSSDTAYNVEVAMEDIFNKKAKEEFKVSTKKASAAGGEENIIDEEEVIVLGAEHSFYTPAKALLKSLNSHRVFSIINGMRHYITSPGAFADYGYEWKNVRQASDDKLKAYPRVKLVKSPERADVYYLYERADGKILKINIPSPSVFNSYPANSWDKVVRISQIDINNIPDVKLIKVAGSASVYYLEGNTKRLVPDAVFISRGFNRSEIAEVNQKHLDSYQTGTTLN